MKQTEIGLIPDDWEVKKIKDFAKVYDGTHQTPHYVDFGVPFYSVENVTANDFYHTKMISYAEHKVLTAKVKIEKGDILMTRIGSIGDCKYIDWEPNASFYVSLALLKCDKTVDAKYISYFSNSLQFKTELEQRSLLTAIPQKINLGPIAEIIVILPPLEEQQRIAKALSDVDALITTTEKLIQKKKNIKQGAMQNLLTGKKRLPGFDSAVVEPVETTKYKQTELGLIPKDWEVKKIKDFAKVYDGTHQTPHYVEVGIPFYSVENVTANDFYHTKFISEEEHKLLTSKVRIEKGDILMTRIGSIGDCKYIDWEPDASFYVSLALIKCDKTVDARFISYYSNSSQFKEELEQRSLITAIPQKINLGPISEIILLLPSKEEQTAIANVLSSMGKEIETLNTKLEKYRNLKTAMMQQLLTGKIRLVK